ncbi:MAG: hypothetical protein UV60_C0035G0008 [Parcubacteria group bacterium GW2011_GWA2_43_11]|nr:MAG: hypothetical protein UU89_C0030G0008 [Parcubacteria group bacterium GW2011_GWC2_42_11]KKS83689.1 MAG: hypothetical protein UV60_C0035G0008 [Parcubacteria group bacterium GW2011_GWA2_43_11]
MNNSVTADTMTEENERIEKQQALWNALKILGNPTQLVVWVQRSKETSKYAFCIAREAYNKLCEIINTQYIFQEHGDAVWAVEHTLRIIVKRFSDEHINKHSEMLTTEIVDWIIREIGEGRVARTGHIVAKPIYTTMQ